MNIHNKLLLWGIMYKRMYKIYHKRRIKKNKHNIHINKALIKLTVREMLLNH